MRPGASLQGVLTALRLPWLMRGGELRRLMRLPGPGAASSTQARAEADEAIRAALLTLRVLSRLRLPFWRSTCLYRSVLRCALLRAADRPAVLRIGVARGEEERVGALAHAWVEIDGEPMPDEALPYTPLVDMEGAG